MAKAAKNTGMIKWDEELAKEAQVAAAVEANTGGGKFFSTKAGVLAFDDAPFPNNQMAVVILDGIFENTFYEGEYDAANPQGPKCFAFGRSDKGLVPHEVVTKQGNEQNATCEGCPMAQWGTADKGRGKACKETRRLAMIPAGQIDDHGKFTLEGGAEHFESAGMAFMRLAVTSVKGYASFVKQVAATLKRPPYGIVTKVKVVPDEKNQHRIVFEPLASLPDEVMAAIMARHKEAKAVIDFPYLPFEEQAEQPRRAPAKRGNAGARKGFRTVPAGKAPRAAAPARAAKAAPMAPLQKATVPKSTGGKKY